MPPPYCANDTNSSSSRLDVAAFEHRKVFGDEHERRPCYETCTVTHAQFFLRSLQGVSESCCSFSCSKSFELLFAAPMLGTRSEEVQTRCVRLTTHLRKVLKVEGAHRGPFD